MRERLLLFLNYFTELLHANQQEARIHQTHANKIDYLTARAGVLDW